jgi:hypothetical protein
MAKEDLVVVLCIAWSVVIVGESGGGKGRDKREDSAQTPDVSNARRDEVGLAGVWSVLCVER